MPYSYQSVHIYFRMYVYTVGAVMLWSISCLCLTKYPHIMPIRMSNWGVTCNLTMILILCQTMRCYVKYQVILDRVVAARVSIYVSTCICVQVRQCTVYPHYPVIHICIFLTQALSVRLSKTPLICIDSAYDVACHTYSTRPPQGRANADCLMNYHK